MSWILAAFLEPILFALANILDSSLVNRFFKSAWALTMFAGLAVAVFLPTVWLIESPQMLPLGLLPVVTLLGFLELFYGYPYFKALEIDDTSVTISLFSLGKILVPVLSFFLVRELLKPVQYLGFVIVVLASAALTYNPKARLRFNASFFYMLLSSVMFAADAVLYKYVLDRISWGTAYVWVTVIAAVIGLICLLLARRKDGVKHDLKALREHSGLILIVGILSFVGTAGLSFAISKVDATVERSISSFQPFFVLVYALLFAKFLPYGYKEQIDKSNILKKILLFAATVVGVALTVG